MKTYIVEKNIKEWLAEHKQELFIDILEACEEGLNDTSDDVTVATMKSMYGVTLFKLPDTTSVIESLRKCELNFVSIEDYEKAARARDCGNSWNNRKIYTENS